MALSMRKPISAHLEHLLVDPTVHDMEPLRSCQLRVVSDKSHPLGICQIRPPPATEHPIIAIHQLHELRWRKHLLRSQAALRLPSA